MSPLSILPPRHRAADTSSHAIFPGARPLSDRAPPSRRGAPSPAADRHRARRRQSLQRRTATHLPHWKIRPWPRHGLGTHPPARRRDRHGMGLRRLKDHASQRVLPAHHDHEGPRRGKRAAPETDEGDHRPGPRASLHPTQS